MITIKYVFDEKKGTQSFESWYLANEFMQTCFGEGDFSITCLINNDTSNEAKIRVNENRLVGLDYIIRDCEKNLNGDRNVITRYDKLVEGSKAELKKHRALKRKLIAEIKALEDDE